MGRADPPLAIHQRPRTAGGPNDDPDPSGVSHRRRLRILVADDEPLVGAALRRALSGHDVRVVGGGVEAVAVIQREADFDLILCDVMMPDLDGPSVYEAVRATHPALLPRFVFITGGVLQEKCRQRLAALPNQVMVKPFDLATVRALVHRAGDGDPDEE